MGKAGLGGGRGGVLGVEKLPSINMRSLSGSVSAIVASGHIAVVVIGYIFVQKLV